jgi:hypothetical protein
MIYAYLADYLGNEVDGPTAHIFAGYLQSLGYTVSDSPTVNPCPYTGQLLSPVTLNGEDVSTIALFLHLDDFLSQGVDA